MSALEEKVAYLEARLRVFESREKAQSASPSSQLEDVVFGATASTIVPRFDALQVDDGHLTVHGPNSFFNILKSHQHDVDQPNDTQVSPGDAQRGKDRLINSAWKERAFEQLANIPEPMRTLLQNHWTWISPLFNFVYRPAFTRDMKTCGPYWSPALQNTILAHSVRWAKMDPAFVEQLKPYDGGSQFYRQAVATIFDDVRQGPGKIPDVQALLLLSAQAIGSGCKTQAWLYTGMAFRLIEDMGLNIDARSYAKTAGLTDEDLEIRNRLFWSCYAWEKLLCLYLGRKPFILNTYASPPQLLLDDSAEIEIWSPSGTGVADPQLYPPTQSHATSCFIRMCALSEILHRVLTHLYDPLKHISDEDILDYVTNEQTNMQQWWDDLPGFLQISYYEPPLYCPPAHIATLNCVFHMVQIQLHRPVLCARGVSNVLKDSLEHHVSVCTSSANAIITLFDLHTRTFGIGHITTSVIYCIYAAASIFLLEVQASNQSSQSSLLRLQYCIAALESVETSAPIIRNAIGLIRREVDRLNVEFESVPQLTSANMELPRNTAEEFIDFEWSSFGPDISMLPPQWDSLGDLEEHDPIFDNSI